MASCICSSSVISSLFYYYTRDPREPARAQKGQPGSLKLRSKALPSEDIATLRAWLAAGSIDQKRQDALELIDTMARLLETDPDWKYRLTIRYLDSGFVPGALIDEKKKIYLSAARGKTKVVDGDVAADKKDLAAELIQSSDERKQQALLEMAELKKSAAELNQVSFKTRSSADKLSRKLLSLKGLLGG